MAPPGIPKLPMWYRVVAVIVGVLSLVVALIVLVDPTLAIALLILLLALGLFFMGLDRLIAGISGHPMGHFIAVVPAPGTPGGSGGPGSGSTPPKP